MQRPRTTPGALKRSIDGVRMALSQGPAPEQRARLLDRLARLDAELAIICDEASAQRAIRRAEA